MRKINNILYLKNKIIELNIFESVEEVVQHFLRLCVAKAHKNLTETIFCRGL